MQPLVSVIIPNYNHSKFLELRLQTVFNQTYKNFEVIILDDKSTDNSLEIINKYKNNPHISNIVLNNENSGSTFKQWDKGIKLAKGELIWIAESDDYNELTFLEELIKEWENHKDAVLAFSLYVPFYNDEFIRYKERRNQYFNGKCFVRNRMARCCYISNASGVLFKKKYYNEANKDFLNFKSAGDYMFWVAILQFGNVIKINKSLTYWRKSSNSVTGTSEGKGITAYEDKKILDYIESTYHLNHWQRNMAYSTKLDYIDKFTYDSTQIRDQLYSLWDSSKYQWRPSAFLKWIISILERHFNILI